MNNSYLKLALRNFRKRKTSTLINVLSLSVGLTCCALVLLFAQHEESFDKGFQDNQNIYRITSIFSDGGAAPTVGLTYSKYLKAEIPEIAEVSRLDAQGMNTIIQAKDKPEATPYMINTGFWVDPTFFNIFKFHFAYGDINTALNAPNTIVLSQKISEKLFGNAYPIGKTVKTENNIYTVTGVYKQDFLNHFGADFFASNNSGGIREKYTTPRNWITDPNYYCYLKLRPGANIARVTAEINAYNQRHGAADMKTYNSHAINGLQALGDIHLRSGKYQSYIEAYQGNIQYLYLLGIIAVAILVLGIINYINLSTAQAIGRAKEVGVMRVLGAEKKNIRYQFFAETMLVSLIGLVLAIVLSLVFLPVFNQIINQQLSFFAPENRTLVLWMLAISVITGALAGIYPALYLSGFRPVQVLKGKVSNSLATLNIRKGLTVTQFAISMFLVLGSIVIYTQLNYIIHAKPGFDQDEQLVLGLNSDQAQKNSQYLMNQLATDPNILSVSGSMAPLISGDQNFYPAGKTINDIHDTFLNYTDENYIKTLGLKLISGTNLSKPSFGPATPGADIEADAMQREVVLNEQAIKALGFTNDNAIGKYVSHLHNGVVYNYRIVGVVKDYHYFSLYSKIGPAGLIVTRPEKMSYIIAKVNAGKMQAVLQMVLQKWKALNPDTPFAYDFMDKQFQYDYIHDQQEQQLMGIFTAIAIFISCLGLLGLTTYTVAQRAREIGIRKVIGASVTDIVLLFSKQYFKLLLIANLIAWPVAWYLMDKWLQNFAYRIQISWWMFGIALFSGLLTAFLAVGFKTIKAAIANPVISLRSE